MMLGSCRSSSVAMNAVPNEPVAPVTRIVFSSKTIDVTLARPSGVENPRNAEREF